MELLEEQAKNIDILKKEKLAKLTELYNLQKFYQEIVIKRNTLIKQ